MKEKTKVTAKTIIAVAAWTMAAAAALGRTFADAEELTVWAILAAAVAAWASAALTMDYVAGHLLEQMRQERATTIRKAVEASHANTEKIANQLVQRLANQQDKTVERVAAEVARAIIDGDRGAPTPIR